MLLTRRDFVRFTSTFAAILVFVGLLPLFGSAAESTDDSTGVASLTPAYAERVVKLSEYKDMLLNNECLPENLDFCARLLYAINESNGFHDTRVFNYPERTVLRNYLKEDEIIEFGRTGKGLDVIYFKDENGKKTDIPALLYLGVSDYNVGLKQVQKAIDNWEKDAPNFLRALYDNDVCVFFQNKAGGNSY
jgi:hypothetical protein